MFPGPGAEIHKNEAGEVTDWDYPDYSGEPYYHDTCGTTHPDDQCPEDGMYDDEAEE